MLLAHTIRAPDDDPVRQATLDPGSQLPVNVGKHRVGRPRDNWTWTNFEELYALNNKGTQEQFKADKWQGALQVAELALTRDIKCYWHGRSSQAVHALNPLHPHVCFCLGVIPHFKPTAGGILSPSPPLGAFILCLKPNPISLPVTNLV